MTTLTQMRPDAEIWHPPFLSTPTTTPVGQAAQWPEPCGLTPAEIRQIILELLG